MEKTFPSRRTAIWNHSVTVLGCTLPQNLPQLLSNAIKVWPLSICVNGGIVLGLLEATLTSGLWQWCQESFVLILPLSGWRLGLSQRNRSREIESIQDDFKHFELCFSTCLMVRGTVYAPSQFYILNLQKVSDVMSPAPPDFNIEVFHRFRNPGQRNSFCTTLIARRLK